MMKILSAIVLGTLALALSSEGARAEVGLVEVCRAGDSFTTSSDNLCPNRSWERPANGKAVLSCAPEQTQCPWGNPEFRYRLWEEIAPDQLVMTCAFDIEPGPFSSVDPCGSIDSVKPRIPKREVVGFVTGLIINGRGTATLSWVIPTRRIDGEALPLDEIDGYVLGWGTQSRNYTSTIDIENGAVTSRQVELEVTEDATIYFAIRTRDTDNQLSAWSNEVAKVFLLRVEEVIPAEPEAPEMLEVTFPLGVSCETNDEKFTCTFTVN